MNKKQEQLLEEYLWKLTKAIADTPGLPSNWMQRRVEDLADIFRPKKTSRISPHHEK